MAWAPLAVSVLGTVLQVGGTLGAGAAAEAGAEFEAEQLRRRAGQVRGARQRSALEIERQGRLEQSRALAVAASSGAGASDPTVINHMANLAAETNYKKMVALYEGEEEAKVLEMEAAMRQLGGRQAKQASRLRAAGTLLSEGASLYSKYGVKDGSQATG